MKDSQVLWVAATAMEAKVVPRGERVVVTGATSVAAALELGLEIARSRPLQVLGVGIAGAYPASGISLGEVVAVGSEEFLDLGAEDGERFLDLWSMGFDPGLPRRHRLTVPDFCRNLRVVRGATCFTCTGSVPTLRSRESAGFEVESMEGAGWATACARLDVPFSEIRSISNFCGPRDRGAWRIEESLVALESFLEAMWKI